MDPLCWYSEVGASWIKRSWNKQRMDVPKLLQCARGFLWAVNLSNPRLCSSLTGSLPLNTT